MVDPKFPGTPCDMCASYVSEPGLTFHCFAGCVGGVVPLPVIVPMVDGEPDPAWMVYDQPCDTCDGTGSLDVTDFDDLGSDEIEIDSESCEDCDGTGEVRRTAPVVTDCPECGGDLFGGCTACDDGEIVVGWVPWTVAPVLSPSDLRWWSKDPADFPMVGIPLVSDSDQRPFLSTGSEHFGVTRLDLDVKPGQFVALPIDTETP